MSLQLTTDDHPPGAAGPDLTGRRRPLPPAEERAITSVDPQTLVRALDRSDRFRRDSALGAILHLGRISFRELTPADSLHILIDGSHVSAHIDAVSPLRFGADGSARYSLLRVVAHNLVGLRADVRRLLRGQRGRVRCNMACEVVWVHDDGTAEDAACGG